jgi:chromosome partitioning protein
MRTIAVVNQKGGCGKTTTAINMAAAFAEQGKRVLLVDFDPQAHATVGLGHDPDSFGHTIHDCLVAPGVPLSQVIVPSGVEHLDLAPANVLLASAEMELAGMPDRELRLAQAIQKVRDAYDLCIIDSPASLGLLTLNALVTSTDVIVPVQVHYYALEGLRRLLETMHFIREKLHPYSMENIRLLLTFVEDRTAFTKRIQDQVRGIFGDLVLAGMIHRDVHLAEAPSAGKSVLSYSSRCKGARDYRALASEILVGSPKTKRATAAKLRKGLEKQVISLFEHVWIPRVARTYDPGSIDAT